MSADPQGTFATTRWSLVLRAAQEASLPAGAREALEELCATAWFPLFTYLRRRGRDAEQARDLVQGFFASLLERGDLARLDPARGRFRSFLLTALEHFASNQGARARTRRRGGDRRTLSLDAVSAEERYALEPADHRTSEHAFERTWARALLDRAYAALEGEYERRGKLDLFRVLSPCLGGDLEAQPYAEIAAELDATPGAVKVAVHRLRARFRKLLRTEIAHTLPDASQEGGEDPVEAEIRHLFEALAPRKPGEGR